VNQHDNIRTLLQGALMGGGTITRIMAIKITKKEILSINNCLREFTIPTLIGSTKALNQPFG